jgi:predicted Zn-dependent protease
MKFRFDFPGGWKTQNGKSAVVAMSPNQDAMMEISLVPGSSAQEAASRFFSQQGIVSQGVRSENIHGLSAASGQFTAQTQHGNLAGQATFIAYNNAIYQIIRYGAPGRGRGTPQQSHRPLEASISLPTRPRLPHNRCM